MLLQTCSELRIENSPLHISLVNTKSGSAFGSELLEQPGFLEVLFFCRKPCNFKEACDFLGSLNNQYTAKQCHVAIQTLLDNRLLEKFNQKSHDIFVNWEQQGWSDALRYHIHINHLKKTNYNTDPKGLADKAMMKDYLSVEEPPKNYKEYQAEEVISLKPYIAVEMKQKKLSDIFRTDLSFPTKTTVPSFEEISWLFHLGFGQTGIKNMPVTGEHVAKTIPSGGSRHPTEVYPIIFSAADVPPGVYHYNVKQHALVLLNAGDHEAFVRKHIITHPTRPKFKMHMVLIFSTIFERSMFRYRESRSYKVLHYDVGHMVQNFASLLSSVGRNSYRGYSFHDNVVDNFLNIDSLQESALSFLVLG